MGGNTKKSNNMDEDDDEEEDDDEDQPKSKANQLTEGGDTDDDDLILNDELKDKVSNLNSAIGSKRKNVSKSREIMESLDDQDTLERQSVDKLGLMSELISFLLPEENVLNAIKRLSGVQSMTKVKQSYSSAEVNKFFHFLFNIG